MFSYDIATDVNVPYINRGQLYRVPIGHILWHEWKSSDSFIQPNQLDLTHQTYPNPLKETRESDWGNGWEMRSYDWDLLPPQCDYPYGILQQINYHFPKVYPSPSQFEQNKGKLVQWGKTLVSILLIYWVRDSTIFCTSSMVDMLCVFVMGPLVLTKRLANIYPNMISVLTLLRGATSNGTNSSTKTLVTIKWHHDDQCHIRILLRYFSHNGVGRPQFFFSLERVLLLVEYYYTNEIPKFLILQNV